uniref:Exonuclease domain-containing protein n=1 Tax=Bursaphelenchus xylophilus TaxID=6326 RepID=A0A1I7SFF2_BURXY
MPFQSCQMSNQMSNESTEPSKQAQQHKRALEFMKSVNEAEFYNELKDKYVLSQKLLELNGFPMSRTTKNGYQGVYIATEHDRRFVAPSAELRNCLRCQKVFNVKEYSMENKEDHCVYHWGKKPAKREPKDKKKCKKESYSGGVGPVAKNVPFCIREVKRLMFRYVNQNTILIGHSLEFDLRALKLVHHNIVDTSMVFHVSHRHSKHSLKALSKMFMGIRIQENGHCPVEDSMAALHLVYVKVDFERRKRLQKKE